jgi:futalosine hydrolase
MLLVCAATPFELDTYPVREDANHTLRLVTGVGIPAVFEAFALAKFPQSPSAILNIGIAGAYPETGLQIGDIVLATSEVYGDIGFELPTPPHFQPLTESPFGAFYTPLETTLWPPTHHSHKEIATGRGCTVSTCTGTDALGILRRDTFGAVFETMEGAAVAQIAHRLGVPFYEVRAISNIAAERDMRPENIKIALESLRAFFEKTFFG